MSDKRQRLHAIAGRSPARCLHWDGPIQENQGFRDHSPVLRNGGFFVFQGRSLALMCGNEERGMWIDRSCALMMSFQPEQAQRQERRGENLKTMVCRQENSLLAQNIVIKATDSIDIQKGGCGLMKKLFAWMLVLVLCIGLFPMEAHAYTWRDMVGTWELQNFVVRGTTFAASKLGDDVTFVVQINGESGTKCVSECIFIGRRGDYCVIAKKYFLN